MQRRELTDGGADCMFSTGADGAKQRLEGGDTDEKKSQISADSGLSVTSGSQVGVNFDYFILFYFEIDAWKYTIANCFFAIIGLFHLCSSMFLSRRVIQSHWRAQSLLL